MNSRFTSTVKRRIVLPAPEDFAWHRLRIAGVYKKIASPLRIRRAVRKRTCILVFIEK